MNDVGRQIEVRRTELGLTREDLAARLGTTATTVFNLERRPTYNIGTRLLRQLEDVLGVEFTINMKETRRMGKRIRRGNDEFILYVRKNSRCRLRNEILGRRIWQWISEHANGTKLGEQPCYWGSEGAFISELKLPKTAHQFEFDRDALPALYDFLDRLGEDESDAADDQSADAATRMRSELKRAFEDLDAKICDRVTNWHIHGPSSPQGVSACSSHVCAVHKSDPHGILTFREPLWPVGLLGATARPANHNFGAMSLIADEATIARHGGVHAYAAAVVGELRRLGAW